MAFFNSQANLSDDELEYSSATNSAGGLEAVETARRRQRAGLSNKDVDEDDEENNEEGFDDSDRAMSFEKPSSLAVRAATLAALGKGLEESAPKEVVKFNVEGVGAGGAGYEWHPNEGFDIQRYSISVPDL